ncbi:orange carotenoid protein N-terminal domain-containing protein [Oscillatoria sp. FACHB-1406]|uniref:orange carotenoid protein N-terminal domain-containing protein n=1 Tax=Oscillatoria sp. FACHB-1406 TaxID=2692846 RepID=UPI001687B756|nr:orange carotenoid protein N-terminal domain-containing protein [Oscillatoria sp. FACHB-1406]MBD2580254.1 Orange carotenoid protein [Oscillatoria sp. FACHB-1406]
MEPDQLVSQFKNLSVDDQLALLWFVYTEMGESGSVTPAAPGAAGDAIAGGLYDQVKGMSHEEQLQVQRDLLQGTSNEITRQYGSLSDNTKLLFWYRLAQGMEEGTVIPMPEGYKMAEGGQKLLSALKGSEPNEQITFLRSCVTSTGSEPAEGAAI